MTKHTESVLLLVLAAVLWSTGGLIIKTSTLSALSIAGMRSLIAAVVMFIWLKKPKPIWTLAQWCGIVSYALTVILFVTATKETTSAKAILLQYSAPIWVALCSWLVLKEKLQRIDFLAILAVVGGIVVLFQDTTADGSMQGNLIAVGSGVAFAGVALSMRAQRGVSTIETILIGNVLAALVTLPFGGSLAMSTETAMQLTLLGTVQLGLSYILYAKAVKHVSAIETVLYTTLEPILNPIWVAWYIHELPSTYTIIGGSMILTGVVVRSIFVSKKSTATP